jgi:polyisoprenoid-binding protein YceI
MPNDPISSVVPLAVGCYRIGPDNSKVMVKTFRQGMAAAIGHDLTLEPARWSGEITVEATSVSVTARIEVASLEVTNATGGAKPLSDGDRRQIHTNLIKTLDADRHREITFSGETSSPDHLTGTLDLAGASRPITLAVKVDGYGALATATIRQGDFGIKPFSAFFGALKLKDEVELEINARPVPA